MFESDLRYFWKACLSEITWTYNILHTTGLNVELEKMNEMVILNAEGNTSRNSSWATLLSGLNTSIHIPVAFISEF